MESVTNGRHDNGDDPIRSEISVFGRCSWTRVFHRKRAQAPRSSLAKEEIIELVGEQNHLSFESYRGLGLFLNQRHFTAPSVTR